MIYRNLDLHSESDVEQKFIVPLLTNDILEGLGYSQCDFRAKIDIRKISIGKGGTKKLYYPDYVIILDGLPLIIIEAKPPGSDLDEAFREARLYATELNANYRHSLNPCCLIIATDGVTLLCGRWDQRDPLVSLLVADISTTLPAFETFKTLVSRPRALLIASELRRSIRKTAQFTKPIQMLGGRSVANEAVGENSFGANISLEYKYLFNPVTHEDRDAVARNAYVSSKRKQSHVSPIDKIIRAARPPSITDATPLGDTSAPAELFDAIRRPKRVRHELCLLVGSVGSGKSTFMDYLRLVALPDDLRRATEWLHVNLNNAPVNKEKIYDWVLREAVASITELHPGLDLNHIGTLRQIFARQLSEFEKGPVSLFPPDSEKYADRLFDELTRLRSDREDTFIGLLDHMYCGRNVLPIVVLDNCDKRSRDDQLLMFEVANWLKTRFACTVFLPIRDTTYDNYCNEPPLDTVIKDLVFRIDPPLLERVVYARLNYVLREIVSDERLFDYALGNGMRIKCQRSEVSYYLKCMIASLFQDPLFKRIITGLAGRNIRKGLEILLDFCKSGHLQEEDILRIRQSLGEYRMPNHLVARILMKGKRRYYSDQAAIIKNMFFSDAHDDLPDPFVRIDILKWLKSKAREYGPNGTRGFHMVSDAIRDLQALGHAKKCVVEQIASLTEAGCISTESMTSDVQEQDLMMIAPGGYIHLDLLKAISYLSTIAEDTFFRSTESAKRVADNILGRGRFRVDSRTGAIDSALALVEYMVEYREDHFLKGAQVLAERSIDVRFDLEDLVKYVEHTRDNDSGYFECMTNEGSHPPGSVHQGRVVSVLVVGAIVEFGLNASGMLHKSTLGHKWYDFVGNIEEGDFVDIEVMRYNQKHHKFDVRLADK